ARASPLRRTNCARLSQACLGILASCDCERRSRDPVPPRKGGWCAVDNRPLQIEEGAPAAVFFSANLDWMDYLEHRKFVDPASRPTLLGNTVGLVAPKDSTVSLVIKKNFPLLQALGPDGKLAMASVATSCPAGKYGKVALTYLGVWDAVAPRVAQVEN